jgi:hypothetical protein
MAAENRTHEPNLQEITADLDGLRELILAKFDSSDKLANERNIRYEAMFQSAKDAVASALVAAKDLTSAVAVSSEKAIVKSDASTSANEARSSELRAQLNNQATLFLPRTEGDAKIKSIDDKMDMFRKDFENYKETQASEIRSLRESRSSAVGGLSVATWLIGIGMALTGLLLGHFWK